MAITVLVGQRRVDGRRVPMSTEMSPREISACVLQSLSLEYAGEDGKAAHDMAEILELVGFLNRVRVAAGSSDPRDRLAVLTAIRSVFCESAIERLERLRDLVRSAEDDLLSQLLQAGLSEEDLVLHAARMRYS